MPYNHNQNHLFLLHEIVKRNFSSKYKDSTLGILWSLLRPLMLTAIFTIIFSTVFGRSIVNYPVYYLVARNILNFFNGSKNVFNKNSVFRNEAILSFLRKRKPVKFCIL